MNKENEVGATIRVPFNQNVKKRVLLAFNDRFDTLVKYAAEHEHATPKKGDFATYVLEVGLYNVNEEEFFKNQ